MKWTDNKIGDEGAMKISESLMKNSSLTQLNLSGDKNNTKWKENEECKEDETW